MNDSNCYLKGIALVVFSVAMLCIMLTMANADTQSGQESQAPITEVSEPSEPSQALVRPLRSKANIIVGDRVYRYYDPQDEEEVTEAETEAPEPEPAEEVRKAERFYDIPLSHEFQQYVRQTAESFGFEAELLFAIMEEESLYRANAVSQSDDWGLCQVNRVCFDWLREHYGITDILDPYQNVIAGCALLKWTKSFTDGSLDQLLLYYGCGVGRGQQLWNQGITRLPFGEKMLSILEEFKRGDRDEKPN